MTTRLLWHSRLSKKARAAAVEAAQSLYPKASDDGGALRIPHAKKDTGPVWIFLGGAGRSPKLFSGIEAG